MKRFSVSLNLFTRVIVLVSTGLLLMFGGFAFLGLQAVEGSTARIMKERLLVAEITSSRVDDLLQQKITVLNTMIGQAAVNPDSPNPADIGQPLHTVNQYLGDFVRYSAVADRNGKVVWADPMSQLVGADLSSNRYVADVLASGKPVISGFFMPENTEPAAAFVVPTKMPNGSVNGVVIAAVNLRHESITHLLGPIGIGSQGYAEIVDEDGFPLASTSVDQSWQNCRYGDRFASLIRDKGNTVGRCHDCHTTPSGPQRQNGVMAFSALKAAPWGVVVQQDEAEAFAESNMLERNLVLFGGTAFAITLVVAWALTRSVVNPIKTLTVASQRIAAGDLAQPISRIGGGEVSALARSFDEMRERLKRSLETIQGWNTELEERVEERTKELAEAEQQRNELLRKLVVAQEEERRGLARELHDETSQALTALVVGLETATAAPAKDVAEIRNQLAPIKSMATEMLREIQRIILDLRPAILDDLGLIQAIDWYAESRLSSRGVRVVLETDGIEKRLPSEVETVVFRIAQEAINNVARHAEAENVSITLKFSDSEIVLDVEDDGRGFDPTVAMARGDGNTSFGLWGIKERAALFGGEAKIESKQGCGSQIVAKIPMKGMRRNGEDTSSTGR